MVEASHRARWWTVALAQDVLKDQPHPILCDGAEIVLFRDAQGAARALADRCAHRRAPLSLGRMTSDGQIECPYHGWRYRGGDGACVAIPNLSAKESVPRAYRVAAYEVAEREGFVFLWTRPGERPPVAPAVAPMPGERKWQGRRLIAYPQEALVDLLLDAPAAVIELPTVRVLNNHRYGDPVVHGGEIVVEHAAQWARTPAKKIVADFPLAVKIQLSLDGGQAGITLRQDDGLVLATARLAFSPAKPTLTAVFWRGAGRAGPPIEIGALGHIDPDAVRTAPAYISTIRREAALHSMAAE